MLDKLEADGSSRLFQVGGSGCHVGLSGSFGGGTITVEKNTPSGWVDLLDEGVAITYTAAADELYNLFDKDQIRFTLAGATSPAIDISVTWE